MQINDKIQRFNEVMLNNKIPGSSLIYFDSEKSTIHNYGTPDKKLPNKKINDSTRFQIGSITKVFTALMTVDHVNRGTISKTTEVGEILQKVQMDDSLKRVTILELLTHTSGLPRLPDNLSNYIKKSRDPYSFYGEKELIEFLSNYKILETNKAFCYSNLGYGLLGFLIENATNTSYDDLLSETIGLPLRLHNTCSYRESADPHLENAAKGYDSTNKETPMWNMNVLKGAGGIVSTPQDIQIFLNSILRKDTGIDKIIDISFQSLNQIMAYGWFKKIAMPLSINFWHNGKTGGFTSYIELNRKKNCGLAILLNKAVDTKLISDLANDLL